MDPETKGGVIEAEQGDYVDLVEKLRQRPITLIEEENKITMPELKKRFPERAAD